MSTSCRKPNLFVIGAMKSATTSLHAYLDAHPEIFMCEPKEPSYFVPGEQLRIVHPVMEEKGFYKSEDRYLELFRDANEEKYVGESSTAYTKLPIVTGVARRLHDYCPEAKIIYIVRDPVARSISHYWWEVRWENEKRDLMSALREEPFYRQVSDYATQIAPYLELFPREQILVLTFEELTAAPEKTMTDIYGWLGVDSAFEDPSFTRRLNETPAEIGVPKGMGLLHKFRHSAAWSKMESFVPKGLKVFARRFSEAGVRPSSVPTAEAQTYLRSIHKAEVIKLENLLNRKFPEWTTLHDS